MSAERVPFKEVNLPEALFGAERWVAEISLGPGRTLRLGAQAPEELIQKLLRALAC